MASNTGELAAHLRKERRQVPKALDDAGNELVRGIKALLSIPYPPAAPPGSPPHRRTGALQNSIKWKGGGTLGQIVTDVEHAKFVDPGTSKMRARPFFAAYLGKTAPQVLRSKTIARLGRI